MGSMEAFDVEVLLKTADGITVKGRGGGGG